MKRILPGVFLFFLLFFIPFSLSFAQENLSVSPKEAFTHLHKFHRAVCENKREKDMMYCHARVITEDDALTPFTSASLPAGYGPGDFRKAYTLSDPSSGIPIIALVDAYDAPTIQS